MNTEASSRLLDRVRKLLAKAEDESVTPPEAQALTAKAAELMAKYGIDRALLAADRPETDKPANRMLDIDNPWARVKAHLLCGLGSSLRCQAILLSTGTGTKVHVFGFQSDLERLDVLYTSVLIQMWHGLTGAQVPAWSRSPRAWRRSWLLGFATAVISRVRAAEHAAASRATSAGDAAGSRTALVLADRASGDPRRGRARLPAHPHRPGHLQRDRLPGRLRTRASRPTSAPAALPAGAGARSPAPHGSGEAAAHAGGAARASTSTMRGRISACGAAPACPAALRGHWRLPAQPLVTTNR